MPLFKNRKILYKHILCKMHRIDITLYRIYMDKFMPNKQTIIGRNRRNNVEKILCIVTQILYLFYILGIPVYISSAEHSSALSLKLELFQLTNSCRRNNNLEGLIELESMDKAAQVLADDMCYLEMLSHYGYRREYRTLSDRLRMNDFIGENIGENIARQQEINDNSYSSTKEIFDVWKNSTEHRKNILGDFVYTGIGTCKDRNGYRYWVQVFGKEYNNKDLMKFKMNGKGKIKEKCDEDGKNGCDNNGDNGKNNSNNMEENNNNDMKENNNKDNKKDENKDNNDDNKKDKNKDNNGDNKKNNIPKIEFIINSKDGKITPPENLPDILNNIYDYFKEKENNGGKDKGKENKNNKDTKYDKDRNNNSIEDIQTITIAIPNNDKESIKIDTTKDNKDNPNIFQQKKDKAPISIVTITQPTSPVDTNKEKDKKISSIIPKDNIFKNKDSDMTDKLTDSLRELKELISSLKNDKNIDIFNKIKNNLNNNNIDDKDNRNRDNDPYKNIGNNRDIRNENNNPMSNRNNDPYKDRDNNFMDNRNNDTNIRNGNNNPMNNINNHTDNRRDNNPMNNRDNNPMENRNNRNKENVFKTPISIINEYPGEIKVVPIEDKEKKENGKNIKLCKYLEDEYKNSLPLSILEFYTKYCNTYKNKRTGNNYTNGNRNINNNKLDFNIIKPNQWNTKNNPLFHHMEFSNDPCKGKDNIEIGLPLYYGVHQ
ncbi:hypothetical protein SLOPH_2368 [Spraguea lophii 42_110]|uniref:SCP domain-containing protein n=1 Tax=Spraguea lophii (strain 42_110) TaxID=1358809 RepID=S7XPM1_SPRLO|nr:hypothetical protein SLOPH_2368 [Spraguea lophii 42_110]